MKSIGDDHVSGIANGLPPDVCPITETHATAELPDIRVTEPTFREVFFAWEKLRLLYNALLLAIVVAMALNAGFSPLVVVFFIGEAAFANVCYCAGPVAEGYLAWIGVPGLISRWFVFAAGCIVAASLTVDHTAAVLNRLDR